jgi:hypothetical protein
MRLKEFIVKYFEDLDGITRSFEPDKNLLTLEVLAIVEKFVK